LRGERRSKKGGDKWEREEVEEWMRSGNREKK